MPYRLLMPVVALAFLVLVFADGYAILCTYMTRCNALLILSERFAEAGQACR